MCQCNKKRQPIYLFFCPQLYSIKNKKEGKIGRESQDEIKEELLKSLINDEIEFKFGQRKKL